jgi:hypothetical protein
MGTIVEHPLPVRAITRGRHHFFGYYDKFALDSSGRYHLAMEVDFTNRMVEVGEMATVGMVDLQDSDRFIPLDTTTGWHWQQGTMLQWWGAEPDRSIVYNVRDGDTWKARIRNVKTGATRGLPRAIYHLAPDGSKAACLNFSRIHDCRPGYGYNGIPDPNADVRAPVDDGVWVMDLRTSATKFIVSLADLVRGDPQPRFETGKHYINHAQWNKTGTRLFFFHLWNKPEGSWLCWLYSVNADGSDLYKLPVHEMVSHYDWLGDDRILAWARTKEEGDHFYLFDDRTVDYAIIGADVMTVDGHCSWSPDRKWILCDTYPQLPKEMAARGMKWQDAPNEALLRTIYVYDRSRDIRHDLGRFSIDGAARSGPLRCDVHPRWSRDGQWISFDSVHEGSRQIYLMDMRELVGQP